MVKVEKESVVLRSLPSPFVCQRGWRSSCDHRDGCRRATTAAGLVGIQDLPGPHCSSRTDDAANRLLGMNGAVTETHTYDRDDQRVKAAVNGTTSVYVGAYFEVTGGITRTYYYAGNVRVAERYSNTLYFLLTDHLGSTATTTDASGNRVTELRYYPYGDSARYNPSGQITTFNFTGQRKDSESGLLFYNARWHDPVVGRFLAADTIVLQPQDLQNLNRYSYCGSNPLRFVDPSGHAGVDFWGGGGGAGAGVGLVVALMQGVQQTMAQVQGAVYQYGPVAQPKLPEKIEAREAGVIP